MRNPFRFDVDDLVAGFVIAYLLNYVATVMLT